MYHIKYEKDLFNFHAIKLKVRNSTIVFIKKQTKMRQSLMSPKAFGSNEIFVDYLIKNSYFFAM